VSIACGDRQVSRIAFRRTHDSTTLGIGRSKKEKDIEKSIRLIVCGDFNAGDEGGAIHYLENGYVDENFIEDGEPVTSSKKLLPLNKPLIDVAKAVEGREPPPTLVVPELISLVVEGEAYENPKLSEDIIRRLSDIYERFATHEAEGSKKMGVDDVENWLRKINLELGRGSEFREAARLMGWKDDDNPDASFEELKARVKLPSGGLLSLDAFIKVYEEELKQGKFWGIAHDLAVLGEPLPDAGVFNARFDRMFCSEAVRPTAVLDTFCSKPCPNEVEPSDHLPVAAVFTDQQQ
jgi:hypothetical protein